MTIKWIRTHLLLIFTAVLPLWLILSMSGITLCHQQARNACDGRVKTVSISWGMLCSYDCS